MNNKFDGIVGIVGIGLGLVGIGYALGTHSKMAKISDNLDRSIDELASQVPVDIPNDMVERAVEKAVAYEVKQAVCKVTDRVKHDVAYDMHKQISDVIEQEYSNVKDVVLKNITDEAAKIDAKRVRYDVEKAAKEKALANAMKTMLGINPMVHLVAPKTIARSEGKAVRVIDKRKLV